MRTVFYFGHLPAIEFYHEYFPKPGDRFWTPADWAWIRGLYDVLFPSWHYGVTVVAHRMRKFDAAHAFDLMARHRVRNAFLVPTTLKMMRHIETPRQKYDVRLRSIFTGGEAVGEEVIRWAREELGVTPHEGYGRDGGESRPGQLFHVDAGAARFNGTPCSRPHRGCR